MGVPVDRRGLWMTSVHGQAEAVDESGGGPEEPGSAWNHVTPMTRIRILVPIGSSLMDPRSPMTRRQALAVGLGATGSMLLGGGAAGAQPPGAPGAAANVLGYWGSSPGSTSGVPSGLHGGMVATDLEVVTVTDTSVTFSWATLHGPRLPYGPEQQTVPADSEVLLGPADARGPLRVVHYDAAPRGVHLVTITGLEPGREYAFECRSHGVRAQASLVGTNQAWSPERTGRVTTLTPPSGRRISTIAILNDTHVGETRHGIIVNDMPTPITQRQSLPPYAEVMLVGALTELRARRPDTLIVNGDCTDEARPAEVQTFRRIMDGYGRFGVDWNVTRGNHDRPHRPAQDPGAGYESVPVLDGTADHRDVWGAEFVPRQELWTTDVGNLRILGVDSCMLDASGGEILPGQMDQIASTLQADPDRPTILFAHHPVTEEAARTNVGQRGFVLNQSDSITLQTHLAHAPGVFLMGAGHTHRARRTAPDRAPGVDFVETGATKAYPGGYTLLTLFEGGYMVNFHRIAHEHAIEWTSRSRWGAYGLEAEYLLGTTDHRNYVVHRDLSGL